MTADPPLLLVVDDDEEVLETTSLILRKAGYDVVGATDGEQGLRVLRDRRPDLVLLDVVMEGMDGHAVCRQIRQDPALAGTFVVMVSGARTAGDEQAAGLALGADGYIARPFEKREFLARIEALLRIQRIQRELRFRTFTLENAPVAALLVDARGAVLHANGQASDLLGLTNEQITSATIHDLDERCDLPRFASLWNEARDGQLLHLETRYRRADGGTFPAEVHVRHLRYRGDEYCALHVQDITERLTLAEQLRQAQKLEAVGRLAGGVAHDFNNLLTGIITNAAVALEELDTSAEVRKIFEDVRAAADRATELTRQLLAFSGKQMLEVTALDLGLLIREMTRMLRRLMPENIELRLELAEESCTVRGDPVQLEQALLNLAINARDAMPDGGCLVVRTGHAPTPEALTAEGLEPGQEAIRIDVEDDGAGIPSDVLPLIFEPFFSAKADGGSGLGLASVYGTVRQHGGAIDVTSEPDEGTRFTLWLPPSGEAPPPVQDDAQRGPWQGTGRVLAVEDHEMLRKVLERGLRKLGFDVRVAGSLAEARQVAAELDAPADLLLTDVLLPDGNGRTLADELLAQKRVRRVLFTSGYTNNVVAHHGVLDDGLHFLAKPFTPNDLKQALRRIFDEE